MWKKFNAFMQNWYENNRPVSDWILGGAGLITGMVVVYFVLV